ncbi:hypothetical protein BH11PLA2_BH11PLA2_02720 [soil metagenome]
MARRWIRSLFKTTPATVKSRLTPFSPQLVSLEARDVPTTFTNLTPITIPTVGTATPYPSTITSSALPGVIQSVSVTFNGVTHPATPDLDVLLVGPNGVGIVLMSDNGGAGNSLTAADLTFSDTGVSALTDQLFGPGTYLPSNFDDGTADSWTGFTGQISTTGMNKTYRGGNPNGIWSLYVVDDTSPDGGSFATGWTIDIVSRLNTPPTAVNDTYGLSEDGSLVTTAATGVISNDTDTDAVDIPTLQAQLVAPPSNGTLNFTADGSFTYTPFVNFNGKDTFTYTLDDGFTTGNTATVNITVTAVDDAPVAISDNYVTAKNTKLSVESTRGVIRNDIHADNAPRVTLLSENFENFTLTPYVSSTETKTTSLLDWTASLPAGWKSVATELDDVTPLTLDPVEFRGWNIHNIDSWIATEGDQGRANFTLGGAGKAGNVLVTDGDAYDDGPATGQHIHNIITRPIDLRGVVANTAKLEFDNSFFPEGGQKGEIQVSYDGGTSFNTLLTYDTPSLGGDNSPAAVNIHVVQPLNNPEGAESALVRLRYTAGNNWWWAVDNVTVTGERTAATGLSATLVTPPANGTLTFTGATGAFEYTPTTGYTGPDTFTYTLSDGITTTPLATVNITVREATPNTVPATNPDAYSTSINVPITVVSNFGFLANDSDAEGDPLAIAVVGTPTKGSVSVNPAGGFTYTPNLNAFGTDSFTYTGTDTFGTSTPATVSITINGGPPVITSSGGGTTASVSVAENSTPSPLVTVAATDPNPGSLAVTYSISGTDAKAFVIDSVTGKLTLAKALNFELPTDVNEDNTYLVTVRATNTLGLFDTQAITVTVTDVAEAFELLSDGGGATATRKITENNKFVTTVTATPVVSTTYALVGGVDKNLFAIDSPTGKVTFINTPDFEAPADANGDNNYEIVVQAMNGSNILPQALTVTVLNANLESRAVADAYSTQKANPVTVATPGVLANDSTRIPLFSEGFEIFTLKPFRTGNYVGGGSGNDFTYELPNGWSRTTTKSGGGDFTTEDPIEYRGWNILNVDSWNKTQGQGRNQFTLGGVGSGGSVLVADGDTFANADGSGLPNSNFSGFTFTINTPSIPLTGAAANTAKLEFDNSFFPEGGQTGAVQVSYDDGATYTDILNYDTATLGGNSSTTAVNVHNNIDINNPLGATSALVRFTYTGGNNWWWAIDNVLVTADRSGATAPTAVLVTGPANGTLTGGLKTDGSFTYNPNPTFVGTDTFTYKFNDGVSDSNVATVTLNVLSPRDLTWTGAIDGNWDVVTTANWTSGGSTTFKQADIPTFDDTGANKTVTLNTSVTPGNVTFNTTGTYTLQGTGKITGTPSLAVQGTGGKLILATANDYSGGTTIGTGSTLQIGTGAAVGSITGNVVDDGSLVFNRTGTTTFPGNITGTGSVNINAGQVNLTGANTFSNGLNLGTNSFVGYTNSGSLGSGPIAFTDVGGRLISNSALTSTIPNNINFAAINGQVRIITPTASVTTLNGTLSGGSPTTEYFIQAGASGTNNAILELTGNNTIQGKINVQRGPVSLGSATAAGTASFFLDSNQNPQGVVRLTGDFTINNNIVVNYDNGSLNAIGVDGTVKAGINGIISSSNATNGIKKVGTGTLTLGAVNTYSGPTGVAAGTLLVNGSIATSSGAIVDVGTTLGGTGIVPGTTVSGTITGGSAGGAGKLSTGNLAVTGTYQADLLGTTLGSQYDQLAATGTVDITGATLALTAPNAIAGGSKFIIIDNDGTGDAVTGQFANLPNEGDSITADGQSFTISYVGGDGNDVTLTRVQNTPVVTGFVVNGGDYTTTQRSRITTVTVNFSGPVVAADYQTLGAIKFTRTAVSSRPTGVIGDIVQTGPAANNHITVAPGIGNSLVLTFDNLGSFTTETVGVENGSLTDGYWKLTVGAFDSAPDDLNLRRLYGDATVAAGGTVNGADLDAFGNLFSTNSIAFDFNNDGTINGADLDAFGNRFSNTL